MISFTITTLHFGVGVEDILHKCLFIANLLILLNMTVFTKLLEVKKFVFRAGGILNKRHWHKILNFSVMWINAVSFPCILDIFR